MDVKKVAEDFSLELSKTEAFQNLKKKRQQLRDDEQAVNLVNKFENKQRELQKKQAQGDLTQEDMQEFRSIRNELSQNEVYLQYQGAIQKFQQVCRKSIDQLSSLMNMDIASYISQGGCC